MIEVNFFSHKGAWRGFTAGGHAGYAEAGQDIVCAAVSALVQSAIGGITEVVGAEAKAVIDPEGKAELRLTETDEGKCEKARLLIEVLYRSLLSIEADRRDFLAVNTIEEN